MTSCRLLQSWQGVIAVYSFVSSAYSPLEVVGGITSGRSLINRRKSMGPKILPCGTPEVTGDSGNTEQKYVLKSSAFSVGDGC